MTDAYEPTPDEKVVMAWLREEADCYGCHRDGRQTVERLTTLELADAIERGEHREGES
jgi:hypothetical protein